jgi:protoporphyrin/coproporphyrin ferrochelatase
VTRPVGVLAMAYGTAAGPADIERYYTDIRGGRPPSAELLAGLRARYAAIGDRFPLLEITRRQARGLEEALDLDRGPAGGEPGFRVYLGMKHSAPFIREGVREMVSDGVERAVGLVLAPHYSSMSVGTYVGRVRDALREATGTDQGPPAFTFVEHWYDHPAYLEVLSRTVEEALGRLSPQERNGSLVLFTAHSLPARIVAEGDPYPGQLRATAELVSSRLGLASVDTAWQSAGRTPEPWLGPDLTEAIRSAARDGYRALVVCPCGFVADHLEILYDVDIEAQEVAREAKVRLERTEMMNARPDFVAALAAVVTDHMQTDGPAS